MSAGGMYCFLLLSWKAELWYNTDNNSLKGVAEMCSQQKVNQLVQELCSGLKPLFPNGSMEAILFGSYARGDAENDSDIDVMVLVDSPREDIAEKTWEISGIAADLLLNSGIVVSPIVENRIYFQQNADFLPFYKNVNREGVRYSA